MIAQQRINIFWFRRDLRLNDNTALFHALNAGLPLVPIFIFDKVILDHLEDKADARVTFIYKALQQIETQLHSFGSTLDVSYDFPLEVFKNLTGKYNIDTVYTNHDYEPYAIKRDTLLKDYLQQSSIKFVSHKDQVIFEKDEVLKDDRRPYTVFTPYSKKWKSLFTEAAVQTLSIGKLAANFLNQPAQEIIPLEAMGFMNSVLDYPPSEAAEEVIKHYGLNRDFPGRAGTSRLGVHLRFGTISIRSLLKMAMSLNEVYVNELIWREFYQMILWHFPKVGQGHAFRQEYESIEWRNKEEEFQLWCEGRTGYPIVDAGIRELNGTGFMHNRVRMVVASFLCKHLLIDWRWGEAYFASKLLDFELASNNGGWQWAAGSGCDAAPFFRIFNPYIQAKKFDPQGEYIRKWVPELNEFSYPPPIVNHDFARKRCLEVYGKALRK